MRQTAVLMEVDPTTDNPDVNDLRNLIIEILTT